MEPMRTVLLSAVGMSPGVLTETVWALAQESPPVIPDEVIAITTLSGKEKLVGTLATVHENEAAADFILRVLRQYTEDPSTNIIASIAGGRKTIGALMLSCMNLLGRSQDRVCHVLANDDYLQKHPEFLYPRNKREAAAAKIQMADIPFVRVRGLYEKETGEPPSSYSNMVDRFKKALPPAIVELPVVFSESTHQLKIGETVIRLSANEFNVALAFVRDRFNALYQSIDELAGEVFPSTHSTADEFRRFLSNVRKKIRNAGLERLCGSLLPEAKARNYHYRNIVFSDSGRPGRPNDGSGKKTGI